ncbi:MAG: hypothetical protein IPL83_08585 [Bdellovibrionales bacterium]|nr:hypothetical protein [Bdellovibrionales bacterium]
MIERLDKDISRSGRNTDYSKLWRLDGALDIESWKKAITHYYRDNPLVGDYLGGGEVQSYYHKSSKLVATRIIRSNIFLAKSKKEVA